MGKAKNNKFKRPRFSAGGLSANAVKEVMDEDEVEVDSPAAELMEKVRKNSIHHHSQNFPIDSTVLVTSH